MSVETHVLSRYSKAAKEKSAELCCPIDYDVKLLNPLPQEIIDKDYGCGDPSRYVQTGDTVLDLGSGGGKICYMAAQITGKKGKVIGIDMNDDMLTLARKYKDEIAVKLGYDVVEFHKGYIQELALNLSAVQQYLAENPITNLKENQRFQAWQAAQRLENPLIASDSIDLVISNCVLNLVGDDEKKQLFDEIFRVVNPGGRIAISDIVSDRPVPNSMKQNKNLWSDCISGAFQEKAFLDSVVASGFVGARYDQWADQPWRIIEDIEFRSVTVIAYKPKRYDGDERTRMVIYRGPHSRIYDDLGNVYLRGERTKIDRKTWSILAGHPNQQDDFIFISLKGERPTPADSTCCPPKSCC